MLLGGVHVFIEASHTCNLECTLHELHVFRMFDNNEARTFLLLLHELNTDMQYLPDAASGLPSYWNTGQASANF